MILCTLDIFKLKSFDSYNDTAEFYSLVLSSFPNNSCFK